MRMENLIAFIKEEEYQIIKKEFKKTKDYFNKKELQYIIKGLKTDKIIHQITPKLR